MRLTKKERAVLIRVLAAAIRDGDDGPLTVDTPDESGDFPADLEQIETACGIIEKI